MATEFDAEQVIRDATTAVHKKFPDTPEGDVESIVREEVTRLEGRPVQDYVSVLVERAARKRLKRAAEQ
jgi:hypothetical protein